MTSLRFDSLMPSYIIKIDTAINLGVCRHLEMNHEERVRVIGACDRLCKRIRTGTIKNVVVRKLRT